jgi:hypothetical protein
VRALSAFALVATALIATAVPASARVDAAVAVNSHARLEARGAAVVMPVRVMCQQGASGSLYVQITQNVRGEIASGDKYVSIQKCTGRYERVDVTVVSRTKAFRVGVAFTQATLNVYTPEDSGTSETEREVRLVR